MCCAGASVQVHCALVRRGMAPAEMFSNSKCIVRIIDQIIRQSTLSTLAPLLSSVVQTEVLGLGLQQRDGYYVVWVKIRGGKARKFVGTISDLSFIQQEHLNCFLCATISTLTPVSSKLEVKIYRNLIQFDPPSFF